MASLWLATQYNLSFGRSEFGVYRSFVIFADRQRRLAKKLLSLLHGPITGRLVLYNDIVSDWRCSRIFRRRRRRLHAFRPCPYSPGCLSRSVFLAFV